MYSSNTVNYASQYGYWFDEPPAYSITGNTSTGTNTSASPDNSSAYGFYFYGAYGEGQPEAFNNNKSNGNYYGYYSHDGAIHGTGNTAKGDQYVTYNVEASGKGARGGHITGPTRALAPS